MPKDDGESNYEAARLATRRWVAMNVTELRVTRQLSQIELARRSGVTEREVEDVEAGVGKRESVKCSLTRFLRWLTG
jgi:hypothetical protein